MMKSEVGKGWKGWRPEILSPEAEEEEDPEKEDDLEEEDDLDKVSRRLQVTREEIPYVWDNTLTRLVEKDGSLNTVGKRRLYHWAIWKYKSLMRYSWFSLLIWAIVIYGIFTFAVAIILFWSNDGYTYLIDENTTYISKKLIEQRYKSWQQVDSFFSAFLLAIEMIYTIGYGARTPNSSSSVAVNLTMTINLISITVTSICAGVFLSWLMRFQAAKIKFSNVAVITRKEGRMALMVRLADPVASGLAMLEVSGFCVLVKRSGASHGGTSRWVELRHMGDMSFSAFSNGSASMLPLIWPTVVVHWIDVTSPLFTFTPEILETHSLEIIINVSGVREATGSRILCKTSYIR